MTKRERLKHAEHNYRACITLYESEEFNDWVITTAYYAALHFVCAELFPDSFDVGGRTKRFSCFEDYYHELKRSGKPRTSQHGALLKLVREHIPEQYNNFKDLKDNCWTARYKNYKITREEAELAVEAIEDLRLLIK